MSVSQGLALPVDLTNPGQFFACCGLLELAHRLNQRAVGWFTDGTFHVADAPSDLIHQFLKCDAQPVSVEVSSIAADDDPNTGEEKSVPIHLAAPFNLILDWWRDKTAEKAKLKTWSAGQKVTDMFNGKSSLKTSKKGGRSTYSPGMRDHMKTSVEASPDDWLRAALPIESPKSFSYDSRLSRNNALDLGHHDNSAMAFSPAVDVLVMVGFQRFRPLVVETWSRNIYHVWSRPISIEIAAAAAIGAIPQLSDLCFEFPIKPRDSQGRYKLFGHAQPVRSSNV